MREEGVLPPKSIIKNYQKTRALKRALELCVKKRLMIIKTGKRRLNEDQ